MSLPSKNADLYRRLRLYAFGILLGLLTVKFIYKGKGCQMPNSAKMEELSWQQLQLSELALCQMKCNSLDANEIKQVLKSGKVDYNKSFVHQKPYSIYFIEGKSATGRELEFSIEDCDTISRLLVVKDKKQLTDTCNCK